MAAHCINDVITTGADPLILLDYVAANRLDLEQVAELVEGAAEVCRAAGCRAARRRDGGAARASTARTSSTSPRTCVGHRRSRPLIDGSRRRARATSSSASRPPASTRTASRSCGACSSDEDYDGRPALPPTRLYLDDVRRLARADAHAFAHVTGGGIVGNLAACVPEGLRAELDWDAWERPPVFHWLARHVGEEELRRVFNLGIGYCAVVPDAGATASS